jgi:cell division protein FtsZ
MPKLSPEIETFARIKVIGVGGSGKNALNHMVASKVRGVEFIAMNTDTQDLHNSQTDKKIHLGKNLTKGLGAGMNPEVGKQAAEETKAEVQDAIKGADMVFIACGMGGGTGTGAAPVIARASKEQGILTVGVVTKPFFFEGNQRMRIAEAGLSELSKEVDAIITIPNDRLLAIAGKETSLKDAFALCDDVLRQAVEGISDLITTPGLINVDFADIRAIMSDAGTALMGIGTASGENRAVQAATQAINSPLLEVSINGARGVLFAISGNDDLTMHEVNEAAKVIADIDAGGADRRECGAAGGNSQAQL